MLYIYLLNNLGPCPLPIAAHYLSLIHVQCSLFIKDTIGPTLYLSLIHVQCSLFIKDTIGPSLIHVQCSLFIKDTIGPTLPVLNTKVSSFQRYFCIGLYQLGHINFHIAIQM